MYTNISINILMTLTLHVSVLRPSSGVYNDRNSNSLFTIIQQFDIIQAKHKNSHLF
jgi:hypothetical protein